MAVRMAAWVVAAAVVLTAGLAGAEVGVTLGDANGDGVLDAADVQLINQLAVGVAEHSGDSKWAADVNQDGIVDLQDAKALQGYLDGESTKDGKAVPVAALPAGLALLGAAALAGRRYFK